VTDLERKLTEENALLRQEIKLLRQKLDLVIRQLFGRKSEKLDHGQLELLLSGLEESEDEPGKDDASAASNELVEAEPKKSRRNRERKPRFPEDLPIKRTILVPDAVKASPEKWRRIGEEVSQQYDYEPGQFWSVLTIRPKYVRTDDKEAPPVIAPLPPKLIDRGIAAPGLLAQIIISKYADHLPLYRQEQILRQRHDVFIPRQTMVRWVELVATWLKPVYQEMVWEMFAGDYVQIDEVPVKYLKPGAGQAQQGYFWVYRVPGANTLFDWNSSRGHKCLDAMVPQDCRCIVQCDGHSAYPAFAGKRKGMITLAACWAHVRRKFYKAYDTGEAVQRSGWIIRQIQLLYRIERRLQNCRAGPRLRQAVRNSESRPIINRIQKAIYRSKASQRHRPTSLMGEAMGYALGQWDQLKVFLDHGVVEIDNNLCENAVRPTAIGRKNWLFIGADDAGWRSAVIYSIIESCRNYGIEPMAYMRDVLTRLPEMTNWEVKNITPRAVARSIAQERRDAS
jgi:transposase